jgi:single-strand DNA-binding protein
MAERTIWGHLAADPTRQQAGKAFVTKFRVVENTGASRDGKWVEHDTPTTHYVEAWFELGETVTAQLHKGDGVIVVGKEHTEKWDTAEGGAQYGRILRADRFGIMPKVARDESK